MLNSVISSLHADGKSGEVWTSIKLKQLQTWFKTKWLHKARLLWSMSPEAVSANTISLAATVKI